MNINRSGICLGDYYRARPTGAEEVRIDITGERGILLARALRARIVGRQTLYMTPARAEKWRLLFRAGYTAHKRIVGGQPNWTFSLRFGDGERVSLPDAVRLANKVVAE